MARIQKTAASGKTPKTTNGKRPDAGARVNDVCAERDLASAWEAVRDQRGTDDIEIGGIVDENTAQAYHKLAWEVRRVFAGYELDGKLRRLGGNGRKLIKSLRRSRPENRQKVLERFIERLPAEEQELFQTALTIADPDGPDPDAIVSMAEVAERMKDIRWLWRGWIPFGMLTLLFAPPGKGKSALVLGAICRAVICASNLPDGQRGPKTPGTVLWVDTECAQALTAKRVRDWKLPPHRILAPGSDPFSTVRLDDEQGIPTLRDVVQVHKPQMVVIDSLRSGHGADENQSTVSSIMEPLARLARDTNVAVLVIHHSRKLPRDADIEADHARGSNAQVAMARSVIGLDQPDPDSKWVRARVVKSNVAVAPPAIGFRITSTGVECGDAPKRPPSARCLAEASAFLEAQLRDGRKKVVDVQAAARLARIADRTLDRAKRDLNVKSQKHGGGWWWSLPSEPAETTE